MRTALTLDDDAYAAAKAYSHARDVKLGQAVSELIRIGCKAKLPMRKSGQVWVFELPPTTPKVTALKVRQMLDNFL